MPARLNIQRYFWLFFAAILVACQSQAVGDVPTNTLIANTLPVAETPATLPTYTPPVPFPTLLNALSSTTIPTSTSLPASLPKFPLDGYVMVFTKEGDLYFQDGDNLPVKLTHVGEESFDPKFSDDIQNVIFPPKLSDDNQKVVFSRGDGNTYLINTNGTQEQAIISTDWLASFEIGTRIGALNFIPGAHQLFLETHLCEKQKDIRPCSTNIFLANTDAGEIRKLANLGLTPQQYSIPENINISPDGKMIAVWTMDGVDILTMKGKIFRNNILPNTSSTSYTFFPSLFWLPDSSGLIVALPNTIYDSNYFGEITAHTIWRYTIDNDITWQIPLDSPIAGSFLVSPDGNRIVYGGISLSETALYLGNLANGHTQVFGDDLSKSFSWSPDSMHFIHGNVVVTSFDKQPVYGGAAPEWIDSNHFIYFDSSTTQQRVLVAEINGDEISYYDLGLSYSGFVVIKPK